MQREGHNRLLAHTKDISKEEFSQQQGFRIRHLYQTQKDPSASIEQQYHYIKRRELIREIQRQEKTEEEVAYLCELLNSSSMDV